MLPGDVVKLNIIEIHSDNKTAKVIEVESQTEGLLKIKGKLNIRKDGTTNAWLLQNDKGKLIFGNSYFGKYSILPQIKDKYLRIIKTIFQNITEVTPEDISFLKGMANRCCKHDQWDWFTTYANLGYPSYSLLNKFVKYSVVVRDDLRKNDKDTLLQFRDTYYHLLNSMYSHLTSDVLVNEEELDVALTQIDQTLWNKLSYDSKINLYTAERMLLDSSRYILMHYFVTIEQEFYSHYIYPFIKSIEGYNLPKSKQIAYQKTEAVLIGESHFSLGSIRFIGIYVGSNKTLLLSSIIKAFSIFLGEKKNDFLSLCYLLSNHLVSGLTIDKVRNGLAHGNSEVVNTITTNTGKEMRDFLFISPNAILKRILENSCKTIS